MMISFHTGSHIHHTCCLSNSYGVHFIFYIPIIVALRLFFFPVQLGGVRDKNCIGGEGSYRFRERIENDKLRIFWCKFVPT